MPQSTTITEADIIAEVVVPDRPGLHPEAARSILALKFSAPTTKKIRRLLRQNNRGTITADEKATLDKYLRVGQFLDLLQAKARLSLHHCAD